METGATLPEETVTLADGAALPLATLRDSLAVIYFYPKADTPGCTREAQEFSALGDAFAAAGVAVVGVSKDTPAALVRFAGKRALTVRLASDDSGAACDAFGVWGEKSLYGRTYMSIERATFLFDGAGILRRAWRKVRVAGHADEVLAAARALSD